MITICILPLQAAINGDLMKKPNKIQTVLSVASCKLTRGILRKTGRGGTALPGIVAMKVAKNILAVPASEMDIVVVTGTNGKTTTCRLFPPLKWILSLSPARTERPRPAI